jgi:outer membrane receptor for monomeric catechols
LQDPPEVAQATTIADSLMQEQQVNSLLEALRNVPGLNFSAAEARLRLRACGAAPAPRVARTDGSARR